MTPFADMFQEIAAILFLAVAVGAISIAMRQPLIVAFIAVGILVGPGVLGWVTSAQMLGLLADVGIALLLFVVGLRLDLGLIRSIGKVSLVTGLGQVVFTSAVGFGLALALGLSLVPAIYVAVALTFSSTIIIVKLLSDKREIDALHGRIAVGFLIVQDLVVVLAMIVLTAFGAAEGAEDLGREIGGVLAKGAALLLGAAAVMRFVLPRLTKALARSTELLVLFAVAWAVSLAALGDWLGFSREVGAFLAGMTLASSPYRDILGARLIGLRDFLLLFFFIHLGAQIDLGLLGAQVGPAMLLSLFVLVGNPLIVMILMGLLGYRKRTGFLAGLTVAQISEFSLILMALGLSLGHVDREAVGLVTLVGLITIGLSTYMILSSHRLYNWLRPALGVFERRVPKEEALPQDQAAPEVVVYGLGRYGSHLARGLAGRGVAVLGIDFDPQAVAHARAHGLEARYGDAEDPEFPSTLPLGQARWVVATMPGVEAGRTLLAALAHVGYAGKVALTAHTIEQAEALEAAGADRVLLPFRDAAEEAAGALTAEDVR